MKILVTGANGFVGKNLIAELNNLGEYEILAVTRETTRERLEEYCAQADFIFHLAGVNRPKDESEFQKGNLDFTNELLTILKDVKNTSPIVLSSSSQAKLDNAYGKSKKDAEDLVRAYGIENNVNTFIYRFNNLYGKWSKPFYNTVVATFCYQIARGQDIKVSDANSELNLSYIDDVVKELIRCLHGRPTHEGEFTIVPEVDRVTVGKIRDLIYSFKYSRKKLSLPQLDNRLEKNLYSTYLSFLPEDNFSYPLQMNVDNRGSFTEFIRTPDRGQISINVAKPGITKGNHWHHTKNEKFLVVSGEGSIKFRKVGTTEVIEYLVSGNKLEVVDIPVGFVHSIENIGKTDLVTVMWVNEAFDPKNPDTYYSSVI